MSGTGSSNLETWGVGEEAVHQGTGVHGGNWGLTAYTNANNKSELLAVKRDYQSRLGDTEGETALRREFEGLINVGIKRSEVFDEWLSRRAADAEAAELNEEQDEDDDAAAVAQEAADTQRRRRKKHGFASTMRSGWGGWGASPKTRRRTLGGGLSA